MALSQLKILPSAKERLDEVLTVAARLIARDGFERASVRAIAQEANLSQAGLYHYFTSKEDLLFQVQKHTFTALRNSLAARLDASVPAIERFRILIENHLEFFIAHMDELRVCAFEHQKLTGKYYDQVLVIRRDYFRIAHNIVREIVESKKGSIDNYPDSRRVTMYFFGALNWIHMWFDARRKAEVDILAQELADMVLFGIANRRERK